MMNDTANYLSKEKFDELTTELEHLKTVRRREIAEQLEYARSLGDLSENAEYEEARNMRQAAYDLSTGGSAGRNVEVADIDADLAVDLAWESLEDTVDGVQ